MDQIKNLTGVTGSGRQMKFPYTLTAQIRQFPYTFYWNNHWMFKYWIIASALSFPIFYKISRLANSPENKKKWAEQKAKEAKAHH